MNTFICYDRCSTCKKAEDFLKAHNISFEKRPIKEQNPSAKEIHEMKERSGLPLKRFFNTSGQLYKSMELKDKLPNMSEEEQEALLATDGMLVKRPILLRKFLQPPNNFTALLHVLFSCGPACAKTNHAGVFIVAFHVGVLRLLF